MRCGREQKSDVGWRVQVLQILTVITSTLQHYLQNSYEP